MTSRADGFSLVELLLSAAIMTTIAGSVFLMLGPARELLRAQPERSDVQQRLRVAVGAIQRDLVMAGAGPDIGRAVGPLHQALASVLPYRVGERNADPARGVFYRPDVLSIVYVPLTPAQAVVRSVALAGSLLTVTAEPNCGDVHDRLCGFAPGTPVLLFDATGAFETGSVTSTEGMTVNVEGGVLHGGVAAGGTARLVEVVQHTYWFDPAAATPRLMHYDGRRTDAPVVDHVVDLQFEYFGTPQPPGLLPGVDLDADDGPWTTYGPRPPPPGRDNPGDSWAAGENCVFGVVDDVHVPRLAVLAPGSAFVRLDPATLVDGPWCPDAAHPRRFDADLLRIRRVRMIVRVQASSASLRGPSGRWFSRDGTPVSARGLVPDQEARIDVSPRNLMLTP